MTMLPAVDVNTGIRLIERRSPSIPSQGNQTLYEGPNCVSLKWLANCSAVNANLRDGVCCVPSPTVSSNA